MVPASRLVASGSYAVTCRVELIICTLTNEIADESDVCHEDINKIVKSLRVSSTFSELTVAN